MITSTVAGDGHGEKTESEWDLQRYVTNSFNFPLNFFPSGGFRK